MQKVEHEKKLSGRISFRVAPVVFNKIHEQANIKKQKLSDYMREVVNEHTSKP